MKKKKFIIAPPKNAPVSDEKLLSDLRNVAKISKNNLVSQSTYMEMGKYDTSTIARRFGSWNKALSKAGLNLANRHNIPDAELFENILTLWQVLGRQPRRKDLVSQTSRFSQSPYKRRFKGWTNALNSFSEYINSTDVENNYSNQTTASEQAKATPRDPSLRLRYKILKRDNFRCVQCGASPAITSGVELQLDHIIPWSKGGKTTIENLKTLCSTCNIGKGNL